MRKNTLPMNALAVVNSNSPGYREGVEFVLPYLEHFGIPYTLLDLYHESLPKNIGDYPLVIIAHHSLDPRSLRLCKNGRRALLETMKEGGLVSFDPALPATLPDEGLVHVPCRAERAEAWSIEFSPQPHTITARHEPGETIPLVGALRLPPLAASPEKVLLSANGQPLLGISSPGQGRLVQWASCDWMHSGILGPMAGLDDVLWRSLVWAARKPFTLRGLPPLVTMRVDDVAGTGGLWQQSPLYWVHTANAYGFKPWLGLFIYNLTETAVSELRGLLQSGLATAFPHAFGRPPRPGAEDWYYYEQALPLRAVDYDEFIYFDHHHKRPWSDREAARGLTAVDDWYAAHAPLPISPYAIAHWGEMGCNTVGHVRERWGADLIDKYNDIELPLNVDIPWLKAGPFRRYEQPGTAMPDPSKRGSRPIYYADFVNFGGVQFFLACTEIRDDAGYEWAPNNDTAASAARGVRQLRRALDSMALPILFTHETDFIYKISPDAWADIMAQVATGIASYNPIYVTLDEGVRYVRATKSSRFESCWFDPTRGEISANFSGYADMPTHFHVFTESRQELVSSLVEVPTFKNKITVSAAIDTSRN